MRDRVERGQGMLFLFGLGALVAWWWHRHTSPTSFWWLVTLVAAVTCAIGIARGAQLVLSGFSGFGRNFHEERDAPEEGTTLDSEAAVPLSVPIVMTLSGIVALLLRVFPALNSAQEFSPDHWVSPGVLVPWMFIAGFLTVAWSVLLLAMMKTGPDRWAYVPGTRDEIGQVSRIFIVIGVVLIGAATAFTIVNMSELEAIRTAHVKLKIAGSTAVAWPRGERTVLIPDTDGFYYLTLASGEGVFVEVE